MARSWVLNLARVVPLCCILVGAASHQFLRENGERMGLGYAVLPPKEVFTILGAEVLLPCQPITTEKGVANVTWTNKGQVVNELRRYSLPNGTLFISEMQSTDEGVYHCLVTLDSHSVTSAPLSLIMAIKGTWQLLPRNRTVKMGSAVRITCRFSSLPRATHTWLKDGQLLRQNEARYYQPLEGVLQITNVTYGDAGVYRCQAVIKLLKEEVLSPGGFLTVQPVPLRRKDAPVGTLNPLLVSVPSKVSVEVGNRGVIECLSDDLNQPKLVWSRLDERPIRSEGVTLEGQGSLVLSDVKEEDRGAYNCSVTNNAHNPYPTTQIMELVVLKPPTVALTMTIRKIQRSLFDPVVNGGSVRITCESEGYQAPSITWYKDGQKLVQSTRHRFGNVQTRKNSTSELAIVNLMAKDIGVYQCITENRVGVASEGFFLTINLPADMPKAPVDIHLAEATHQELLIVWSQPPGPTNRTEVLCYILHYKELGSEEIEKGKLTNKTSFKLQKLQPYTNYTIYIRTFVIVKNESDPIIGEPSERHIFRTKASYASRMPKVTLQSLSPNELNVTWEHLGLKEARGTITEQELQWRKKSQHYYEYKTLPVNISEYIINVLQPSKWYEVRLLVSTEGGYPPHKKQLPWESIKMPKTHHRQEPTDKPFGVHLSVLSHKPTEIVVEWTMNEDLVENVHEYMVAYNHTPNILLHHVTYMPSSATVVTLTDLAPETCYTVKVAPQYISEPEEGEVVSENRNICTLPLVTPATLLRRTSSQKLGVKKVKVKVLNTTSVLVMWRPKRRKIAVDFFTVKVLSLRSQRADSSSSSDGTLMDTDGQQGPPESHTRHQGDGSWLLRRQEKRDGRTRSDQDAVLPHNTHDTHIQNTQDSVGVASEDILMDDEAVRYLRVTRWRAKVVDLKPLHSYEITVTASTTTLTSGPSQSKRITTKEGVPTAPVNVTYHAMSPKDVILTWGHPRLTNGFLTCYLVTYSHNLVEWRNLTVASHLTTTKIQDLVSNTNYTLKIAGVTGGGVGAFTTIFVYISATLIVSSPVSTELLVICVVCLLAVVTCVVVVVFCLRILRLRQSSAAVFQGGPGSHDDGLVTNSLFDPSGVQMHQASVPNESLDPLRDGVGNHRMLVTLDDPDDGDDASRQLLQNVSAQPVFAKNIKEREPRSKYDSSTQGDHHSATGVPSATPIFS